MMLDQSADAIDLNLLWQALTQPPHAYTVFVARDRRRRPPGGPAGQHAGARSIADVMLAAGRVCQRSLFDSDWPLARAGRLQIEVGLYRGDTGVRLPRSDAPGDSVTLACAVI